MEKIFEQYKKLINERVYFFSKLYSLEFQELQSYAFLKFCEIMQKYNSEKGSISHYLYSTLSYRLHDYCMELIEERNKIFPLIPIVPYYPAQDRKSVV